MDSSMRTLVLNSTFMPLSVVTPKRSISLLMRNKINSLVDSDVVFNSEKSTILVRKVAVLKYFVKAPDRRRIALSKENIFLRDQNLCQYCGDRAESVDHIIPKSKGGLHEWDNVVACCKACNLKKADKLLHQTGLSLLDNPRLPSENFWIKSIIGHNQYTSWHDYLLKA